MNLFNSAAPSRRTFLKTVSLAPFASAIAIAGNDRCASSPRNVLFMAIDDLNDWLGCMGGHPQALTPHLDQLAAQGMLFENAHCQAPICTPSRASLLSGKYPHSTGLYFLEPQYRDAETLRDSTPLPQYFREHGFLSLGAGKVFHTGNDPHAFDEYGGEMGGFGPRPPQKISLPKGHPLWDWGAYPERDEEMPDFKIAQWAMNKLQQPYDRPFFLSVGFYRPHVPMYAPPTWFDKFPRDKIILPPIAPNEYDDIPAYARKLTHAAAAPRHAYVQELGQWPHAVQAYLACVAFVDHCVGQVLHALETSPHADNTLVVLWSDHGFHLGDKARWGKRSLWEEATRAPLIIAGPDIAPNQRCRRPVGMIDLYPTLVDLCGLPTPQSLEGQSLRPLLRDPNTPWERPTLTTFGPNNHSLRSERWRYTRYANGAEELYDHDADPGEHLNLADNPQQQAVLETHRRWLPAQNRDPLPGSAGADSPLYGPLPLYE